MIAALAGIAGYFNLVPGGRDLLTLYDRARGTFKDPNVLGAFLILPALFALQSVVSDKLGKSFRSAIAFGIMSLAILLAFSRAAWGVLIITSGLHAGADGADQPLAGAALAHHRRWRSSPACWRRALVAVLLSFDSIAQMFKQRASFDQSYDEGRFGRFGRHILGAEMALDLPFGIGPLQFNRYFPEDTHNSYLNAFMSGGWLSGVCYPALVFVTVLMGFRYVFVRVPWQRDLSGDLRGLPRHGRRELHHRHRPLAAFLDDAGRDVGHVRRRGALQGQRRSGAQRRGVGFLTGLARRFSAGASTVALSASVAASIVL